MKGAPRFPLVGPFDIFDPNCCEGAPEAALKAVLLTQSWDVVGFSTTGMTLRHDLALSCKAEGGFERISKSGGCLQP